MEKKQKPTKPQELIHFTDNNYFESTVKLMQYIL